MGQDDGAIVNRVLVGDAFGILIDRHRDGATRLATRILRARADAEDVVQEALPLVNIVTVAIVSTPVFGWFGVDRLNTFVTYPPFVCLPAILVTAALMGHVLVWRWLSSRPSR